MLEKGTVVELRQGGGILCGICLERGQDNVRVLSEQNRELSVARRRLLAAVGPRIESANRDQAVARLVVLGHHRQELAMAIPVDEIWDLLVDDGGEFTCAELAISWFGDNAGPDQVAAMERALLADRLHFEAGQRGYLPRSREHVESLLGQRQASARRETWQDDAAAWLAAVGHGEIVPAFRDREGLIKRLTDLLVWGDQAPMARETQDVLRRAELTQAQAFGVLVNLGIWSRDENLDLIRHRLTPEFATVVHEEVTALSGLATQAEPDRVDLLSWDTISIDDPQTTEVDDALSLRRVDDLWEIGVHIADVAGLVAVGSRLDEEAAARGCAIYLPDLKIPMFPPGLGSGICSLREGEDRRAFTLLARIGDDRLVRDWKMFSSLVRVKKRFSYQEVDAILGGDAADPLAEMLHQLYRLARDLRGERKERGALLAPFPRLKVQPEAGGKVTLTREPADGPAQVLVSEFMILMGGLVAGYCRENRIPCLYRSQPQLEWDGALPDEFTPVTLHRLRRRLRRGEVGLEPVPHHGLGLECYVQVTSPIRRYADLVMQRQLAAVAAGREAPYREEDLRRIMIFTEENVETAAKLERNRNDYWVLKYLEEKLGGTVPAVVLDESAGGLRLGLIETLQECLVPLDARSELHPGDMVTVRIARAFPREGSLRVSIVSETPRGQVEAEKGPAGSEEGFVGTAKDELDP